MKWLRNLLGRTAHERTTRAQNDPPTAAATARTRDLSQLRQAIAAADDSARVACQRELGDALAAARQRPLAEDAAAVWVAAVCRCGDKAQAIEWSAALTDEAALADIAAGSRSGEVRLAAAQRLSDAALLERVAGAIRDKDKRVFRHCTEQLRDRRESESRAQRLSELAGALRELLSKTPVQGSKLPALEQQWQALCKGNDDEGECAQLMERVQTRFSEELQCLRSVQAQRKESESLRGEIADAQRPSMKTLETWALRRAALEDELHGHPAWLAAHAETRALREALHGIEGALADQAEDMRRIVACERFIEGLLAAEAIDASAVAAWEALPKPASAAAQRDLHTRWDALRKQRVTSAAEPAAPVTPAPTHAEARAATIDRLAVEALLADIERHLEEGRLTDAERLDKQIERAMGSVTAAGALGRRWRSARGQIARLRGWARWGTDQVREHLIVDAEELPRSEPDVSERARLVPALRREWKRLNAHGAGSKAQWERFDAALTQAYQPVVEQRTEAAARHEAARAAKDALCAQWETWLDAIAWEYVDYKVVEARRQDMLMQWRGAATAGFRDERGLRKRFDALLARVDAALGEVRRKEFERRERLIEIVEGLGPAADLRHAIPQTKAAQARWRDEAASVRLSRSDEQALWQRFRSACDAVFAKRDAQHATSAAQREQQAQARLDAILELESRLQGADADTAQQAVLHFRKAWGESRAEQVSDPLEERAREVLRQAEERVASLREEECRMRFELMAQKAALAQRVEAASATAQPTEGAVAEARAAWSKLAALPHKTEALLAQRLTEAVSATPETLGAGHALRSSLLLDLEIALGLASPEAQADARRERQLSQLREHFAAASAYALQPELMVAQWYATGATPDSEHEARMAAIVQRLCGAP